MTKWHDLKKNPEDLPEHNKDGKARNVAVCVSAEDGEHYIVAQYSTSFGKWYYLTEYPRIGDSGEIMKWAYIEEDEPPKPDIEKIRFAVNYAFREAITDYQQERETAEDIDGKLTAGAMYLLTNHLIERIDTRMRWVFDREKENNETN